MGCAREGRCDWIIRVAVIDTYRDARMQKSKCVAKEGEKDFQFHMAGIDQKTQWLETWELVALAISETWGAVVYLPRLGYLMR